MLQQMEANNQAEQVVDAVEESQQAETPEVSGDAPAQEGATEEPKYSAAEEEAMKKGWKPRDQYEGEDWRPAKEFLDRGELLDKLHKVNRELKEHREAMKNVETLMKRREEFAAQKAIENLKLKRVEAIQNGDVEQVDRLDEDLQEAQKEIQKPQQIPEAMKEWATKNKAWFNNDTPENIEMIDEARKIEERLMSYKKDLDPTEALVLVEQEIKRKFPHRFAKSTRTIVPDVESNTPPAPPKKPGYDTKQISDDMRRVARQFVQKGAFKSEKEYYDLYFGVK